MNFWRFLSVAIVAGLARAAHADFVVQPFDQLGSDAQSLINQVIVPGVPYEANDNSSRNIWLGTVTIVRSSDGSVNSNVEVSPTVKYYRGSVLKNLVDNMDEKGMLVLADNQACSRGENEGGCLVINTGTKNFASFVGTVTRETVTKTKGKRKGLFCREKGPTITTQTITVYVSPVMTENSVNYRPDITLALEVLRKKMDKSGTIVFTKKQGIEPIALMM